MNITLWIIQILLAAIFLTAGSIKLVLPVDRLARVFEWIDDFSQEKVKAIGAFEILGGLGLFLPGVYGIGPILIPLAAAGLAIIMVLAAITHFKREEKPEMIVNIVLFVFLAFVVLGRLVF